jgi:hypothetical protein
MRVFGMVQALSVILVRQFDIAECAYFACYSGAKCSVSLALGLSVFSMEMN